MRTTEAVMDHPLARLWHTVTRKHTTMAKENVAEIVVCAPRFGRFRLDLYITLADSSAEFVIQDVDAMSLRHIGSCESQSELHQYLTAAGGYSLFVPTSGRDE